MYLLGGFAALVIAAIAYSKKWRIMKVLCYFIALILFCIEAIRIWVSNFGHLIF